MEDLIIEKINKLKEKEVDSIIKEIILNSLTGIENIINVETRIKKYESIVEKMKRKNYRQIEEVKDLLGIRIVCKNIKDVYKIEERMIKVFEKSNVKDYIKKNKHGYRGIHIYNIINIKDVKNIPIEIQIKTIAMKKAQDKTHDKIYKNSKLPKFIKQILNFIVSNYVIIREKIFNKEDLLENYM